MESLVSICVCYLADGCNFNFIVSNISEDKRIRTGSLVYENASRSSSFLFSFSLSKKGWASIIGKKASVSSPCYSADECNFFLSFFRVATKLRSRISRVMDILEPTGPG